VVLLFICVTVLAVGYSFWYLNARPTTRRYGWHVLWRLAFLIAAVRIGALWLSATTNDSSGWVQVPGYFLELVGLPEIYLVRSMRNTPMKWGMAASLLLLASSFVWAASLVWVANRVRPKTNGRTNS